MNEPKTDSDQDALDGAPGDTELSDEQLNDATGGVRQTPKTDFGDRMKAGLDTSSGTG